jgi:lipid II:glycine glycyltransferase (peptidoglycan interpeptide bridge formation enzyme)
MVEEQTEKPTEQADAVATEATPVKEPLESKEPEFDMSSFIDDIKKELAEDEQKAKRAELDGKKDLAKQIYKDMEKNFQSQEKTYQEKIQELEKQQKEMNERISKMSDGSRDDPTSSEESPFKNPAPKALSGTERMKLIKEDLVKKGILFPEALHN